MTEEIMTNELKYSGRIAQIGIYFRKFLRMFVYQSTAADCIFPHMSSLICSTS